jgi:hypothetical protein
MSRTAELIKFGILASVFLTVLGLGLAATWDDATYLLRKPAPRALAALDVRRHADHLRLCCTPL